MTGTFLGIVADEAPTPHDCVLPTDRWTENLVWRCECGRAWRAENHAWNRFRALDSHWNMK